MNLTYSKKPDSPVLLIFIILFTFSFSFSPFSANTCKAQVLIAGTSFDPSPGNEGRHYIGINDIVQYGLQTGTITVFPPLAPNVNAGVFNATHYYAITDNPWKLDNTRYMNNATPDYQLVISPTNTATKVFEYRVTGLNPGSVVEVRISYCNVQSATSGCNTWDVVSVRSNINPQNSGPHEGTETTQQNRGNCGTFTYLSNHATNGPLRHADANGEAVFSINTMQNDPCRAFSIRSVEIYGTPKPKILSAQGSEVCAGEQITLQSTIKYNGTYQWQRFSGGSWTNIAGATNPAQMVELATNGSYQFRLALTPSGGGSTVYSDGITVNAITCCEINGAPASRQTVYYDNFGWLDMNDKTGRTYYEWDYTNVLNPVAVQKTTTTPFRWQITPAPLGATFRATGPPNDGQYTVAAFLTGYNYPIDGYDGARLEWANRVTGQTTIPNPDLTYDHSGQRDGAALFLNCPANTGGQVLYSRTINNLCFGKQLFFECWIAVFTNSASGPYNPVNIKVRLTDGGNAANVVETTATATRQADGGGVWVRIGAQINLVGNHMIMDIINNQNVSENGNDLVLDDIKIMACAPPAIESFFDLTTYSKLKAVCTNTPLDLFTQASNLLKSYYGNSPRYLFQWTRTPNDVTSWQNLGTPQAGESYTIANPAAHAAFTGLTDGQKVYFRVIAASNVIYTANNNFTAPNYANINDPCKNYSVSPAIEAVISCPLPVDLLYFTGKKDANANKLLWSTSNERNNDYFIIEKSTGKEFSPIGKVYGKGNSRNVENYMFFDYDLSSNNNYYRLKQVDFNGEYKYSNIITISSLDEKAELQIFPNPNNGSFVLSLQAPAQAFTLSVTDINGKVVYSDHGDNLPDTIQLNDIPEGVYMLQVHLDGKSFAKKLVIY